MTQGIDLERLLEQWGDAYMARSAGAEPRSLTGDSPLGRYGRPANGAHTERKRSGLSRRMTMAVAAGGEAVGVRVVPLSFCDPVPCAATRSYKAPRFDPRETPDVDRVQDAWLALYRTDRLQATVLRIEYQTRGRQADKAESLQVKLNDGMGPLPLRRYRDELKLAKAWMAGKLS